MKNTMAVDPEAADEHPAAQAPVATPSKSNLFSDEPLPTGVSQLGSKEVENDASGDADAAAEPLDMKELERLRKINSWALYVVATISKMKSTMLQ